MNNIITLEDARSYTTEASLDKGLRRFDLDHVEGEKGFALRYIKCRTPEGKWTAIFLLSEWFRKNESGGYIGFVAQHGFLSV